MTLTNVMSSLLFNFQGGECGEVRLDTIFTLWVNWLRGGWNRAE